jgi:hypothetical protein
MTACPGYQPLLLDEVAGAIAPADAARLELHRRGCDGCRAEGAALAETLSLLRLPPVQEAERRALGGLAASTGRELRRRAVARAALGLGGALAAAAAAAILLVLPLTRPPAGGAARAPAAAAAAAPAWQAPDPDALWRAADLFEDDDASTTPSAAALAALED